MVEIKITRSSRVEGDDFIAIKTDEYKNGAEHKMVRSLEEHNITKEIIDEVINDLYPKELEKVLEEITKLTADSAEMKVEALEAQQDQKYLDFKEMLKTEESKKFFELLAKEKALSSAEARLKELERVQNDVLAWGQQFSDLKTKILEFQPQKTYEK